MFTIFLYFKSHCDFLKAFFSEGFPHTCSGGVTHIGITSFYLFTCFARLWHVILFSHDSNHSDQAPSQFFLIDCFFLRFVMLLIVLLLFLNKTLYLFISRPLWKWLESNWLFIQATLKVRTWLMYLREKWFLAFRGRSLPFPLHLHTQNNFLNLSILLSAASSSSHIVISTQTFIIFVVNIQTR